MKKHVKIITLNPKILAMNEEDRMAWFERTGIRGKYEDYFPQVKPTKAVKTRKK